MDLKDNCSHSHFIIFLIWIISLQAVHSDERLFQTISYKLPSESYAIFRLKTNQILDTTEEDVRQRRHLELPLNSINPHRARKESQRKCRNNHELSKTFSQCSTLVQEDCDNSERIGQCLLEFYPGMAGNLTESFGGGMNGDELFENDETCTAFVRDFFAQCRHFIPSCQEVKGNQRLAATVLGCLFSQYSDLMLPLLPLQHRNLAANKSF